MTIKLGRMVTYIEKNSRIMSHDLLATWSHEVTWQIKNEWQKITVLKTFLYDQSFETLVQHLIIHLAKHLAKLLSPLSHSEITVKNTKAFIQEFKNILPPDDYKLISFDVTLLWTNIPLDYTISIILKRIYDHRELETKISRKEMKDLLLVYTKNVHFS